MPISRHLELAIALDLKWSEMSHKILLPEVLKHAETNYVLSLSQSNVYFINDVRTHNTV